MWSDITVEGNGSEGSTLGGAYILFLIEPLQKFIVSHYVHELRRFLRWWIWTSSSDVLDTLRWKVLMMLYRVVTKRMIMDISG